MHGARVDDGLDNAAATALLARNCAQERLGVAEERAQPRVARVLRAEGGLERLSLRPVRLLHGVGEGTGQHLGVLGGSCTYI